MTLPLRLLPWLLGQSNRIGIDQDETKRHSYAICMGAIELMRAIDLIHCLRLMELNLSWNRFYFRLITGIRIQARYQLGELVA